MKNLITYLKTLWSRVADSQRNDSRNDCRRSDLRRSPSGFNSKLMLKLVSVLVLILTIGSGNAWATDYQLIKSTDDLEAGAHYVLGATYNSTFYCVAKTDNTNNRKIVSQTVSAGKVTPGNTVMTFTLGGNSSDGWTFSTDNYSGTAGYLNATSTTSSNYLKVVSTLDNYAKFSISITAAGVATITCKGKTSRHIMYLNGTTCVACYNNQTGAQYVKLGLYKEVASCSVVPTVGSTLSSVSSTVNSITAMVPISAIGGCNITENGLVYSTTNSTPTVGGTGCTKVTVAACGSTAANKTVTISNLSCGTSYYIRGYATNDAGTSYTNVKTQSTSACPKYTVTLKDNDETLTQASAGAGVTLPTRTGCAGYTFAGWTKTWVAPQSSWTTTAPTIIPAGSYTPTANENLYPVYTKTESGGSSTITFTPGTETGSTSVTKSGVTCTMSTMNNASYYQIYANASGTFSVASGNITAISFTCTASGTSKYGPGNASADVGTYSYSGSTGSWSGSASSITISSTAQVRMTTLSITCSGGSTTYYISVPDCCTDPGLNYGTGSVTKTFGDAVFTNTLTNSHSVAVTYSSSDPTVATVNGSGQVTILKAGSTTITASSIAQTVSTVDYCADEASYTLTVNKANITPTLSYTPNSVAVGENTSAPTVDGNPGSGGVTYAITSATPSGCATINTSTGVVTGAAVGSVTVTATVAATTNYNGGTATANVTIHAASYFTNGATVFIQAESNSAWDASACVKAWFNDNGADSPASETYWLFDAAGGGDDGKKLFATVVPADGTLNKVQLQRFASNCSTWWNSNGDLSAADAGGSNTFRSTGSGTSNVAWNGSGMTLDLKGDPNSWGSSLGTFADQGNGVWTATYNNYAPANAAGESQEFKISTNYNGWIGNTGSNNNATLDGMHVGSTYNITATLDVKDHSLTMSKTFVKGTVHFDLQGHGSAISDLTNVAAGSKISAPSPAPSATGYDFGGWYKEPACTNAWNFGSDVVNETMTLYAKWTAHEYTITKTLTNVTSSPAIPSTYTYTGAAAGLNYTISPSDGYRLPTTITVSGTTYTWNSTTGALVLTGTITSDVAITITAVQTHTVTWMNNGSNYGDPVVYDHGTALVLPASDPSAPSSCSEKVFVGWTSDSEITSETSTEPTLITAGGAVNADITYRAVFADEEGGGTTTIFAEPFSDYNGGSKPSSPGASATVLAGQTISYTFTNGTGTGTNTTIVQDDNNGPYNHGKNVLIRQKNGSLKIDGISTNSQTSLSLSYEWRGSGTMSVTSSTNVSVGSITTDEDGDGNRTCTATITVTSGSTFWLTFKNTSTSANLRFDSPTITCSGVSYDNYITQCCALKPVTNLAVSGTTANSVTLSWTAPSPTTGIDHLELRNASTDVKIGSNIAVGTTTTSVSGLVECNTYSYKIVSVGASCETSSEVIEAQPFSGAKTVTFNYNGGSGSPASFTTSCSGNTVTLPTPDTRAGYTFDGWWTAEFGGVKKGDAGASYTVSGTTTLWAHWSQTNYTVTMAQDPAAGATLTGGTTTAHYGGTINISTTVPSGYRFTGWTASPSVTFADASATSTSFTMPNGNVTVTAHFVQVHTLNFVVPTGGGSAVTPPATADHGGTVTLPNVTGIAAEYSCETFLGWTTTAPNAEGGTKWSSTPTIKAAGATSDVINSNTTFYAVYSRSGGGASGTVELTQSDINSWYDEGNVGYTDTKSEYTATDGSRWNGRFQLSQYSSYATVRRLNLRQRTNASGVSYVKLPTMPGNISSIVISASKGNNNPLTESDTDYKVIFQTTNASDASIIATSTYGSPTLTIDLSSLSYTTGYIAMNESRTINIHSITVNYGPAPVISHNVACPDCEISQFTLSYNANTTYFPGSTTTCTGVTNYIWAEHDDIYTICSTEPTLAGYKFTGWATSANGSGTVYEAGQEISCVPETPLTLYAQYERVYTIHFNDQGTLTDRTQASSGAAVTVPAHTTPCVMLGATWEFAGWSKTGGSLNDAASATIDIAANATEYTPAAIDEGQTFYAVYKKTLSGGGAFSVGKSGVYKFYYHSGSSDYWAAGKQNTYGIYSTTTAGDAHSFRFTYYPTGTYAGKYTIQNDAGEYIGYSGSTTQLVYNASAADNHYYWTITASGGGFIVQNVQTTTRYLASDGGNYNGKTSSNVLSVVAADVVSYYTIMTCASSFSLTFEDGGGTINWEIGHAEGTYQDVADGTVFTVFPTATMDGWTFIGWTAGQGYSDMSKYSAGRDATTGSGVVTPEDADLYSTGGNSYTIHSNITMYPVFTRFEDNEPIDLTNGGDYYIYYLAPGSDDGYGAEQRVYAASYESHKRYNSSTLCSAATTFTFTKLENGNWTIYDNTTNMYLYGIGDDDLKQQASATGAEWTLTLNGNQFDAFHVGTSYGQLIANGNGTSATFMNYRRTNVTTNPELYHRVYLGSCTNRVFSSNPMTIPEIDLKGTVVVTASQNGAVRNTNVLTVSGHTLTPNTGEITITSNNSDVYFSTSANSSFAMAAANQPKPSVTVVANASGIVTPTSIYVHYKPSSNTDAKTDVTITASYTGAEDAEVTAELRTVKENFVIAAKVGDNWYALPANMAAEGVFEPVLIDVDESAKIAYGPATAGYKMWPVQTVNGGTDEYAANGDKVRFAGNSNAGLWASNSNNHIRNWATITAIGSTAETPASYEWIIETEDREAYTLKSMYSTNYLDLYRPSSGAHAGKLVWASNSTFETNEIHFFPLTEREVITIIPREWKANGLVFSVAADNQITAVSYKIGTGSETSTTYTRHSTGGYGLYEVALPDLTSQYGKLLTLKLTISGTPTYATTTIPIIVNANASTKTNEPFATLGAATKDYDVVVLDGKTLTTDAIASGACKFQNLYIYPGATLVNAANNNLSVRYLELRGGIKGIDHKSDLAQGVPHLKLDKNFSSTAGANLDMYVNTAHSYALSVPFDVTLSTVNFANSLNTETSEPINGTLDAQFMIMEYDGAQRASTGKGWKHITSTERVLHAGEGYVLQGKRPKGQPFAVIRFPFSSISGWADGSGEVVKSAVSISAHEGGDKTPDNDKGWNLIANPYMATLSYNGADEGWAADFTVGSLVKTDTDPWDGKYEWESTTNAYVTMPNEWYTEFPQYRANSAQAVFEPFKNFFIQTSADGSVTFDKSKRASAPRHLLAQATKAQPIYADINLTHGEAFAQAGLTVDENATAGYKFGEDQNIFENREALTYLKVYTVADGHYLVGNTMTPAETEELIPVEFYAPNAGEYIFSLDDNSDIDRLEYVILYDAVLGLNTNLLTNDYMVELEETGLIENRFSIGLRIKEKDNSATGIGDVSGDPERPYKFIYRDKMYILRGGKIYDATGKQVKEINK